VHAYMSKILKLFTCSTKMSFLTQSSSFIKCKYYFFCAGTAGEAGAGTESVFCGTGVAAGA